MTHFSLQQNLVPATAALVLVAIPLSHHLLVQRAHGSTETQTDDIGLVGSVNPAKRSPKDIKTLQQIRDMGTLNTGLRTAAAGESDQKIGLPVSPRDLERATLHRLRQKLAQPEADRSTLYPQLKAALNRYFVADMRHRVHELDAIRYKLIETEAKLQERLEARKDVVELQFEVMLSEAKGLNLFENKRAASTTGFSSDFNDTVVASPIGIPGPPHIPR
ncbi:MAG TPA: hypothetical protein DDW52_06855 [Planctomycetaceae bacterium]|nr:hypothetical protein [Planctomycetaceae bacterium]